MAELLTNSRLACFRTCPRKHYIRYELGIVPDRQSASLRFGTAYHVGLERLNQGASMEDVFAAIDALYEHPPAQDEEQLADWRLEQTRVKCMLGGWHWRYSDAAPREVVASELVFEIDIDCPNSGAVSDAFRLAGKIDAIVRLPDGRLMIEEYKTTGDDISGESDYWCRLRMDAQIGIYVLAARKLGYDVSAVLYDVTRKPSIAPKLLTAAQRKQHGMPDGSRETLDMYVDRLTADIFERPDFYHARREVPRLEADLKELHLDIWQQKESLLNMRHNGGWYRNTSACNAPYACEYLPICADAIKPEESGVPRGYVQLASSVHPELEVQ